jgi:Methyltransferase domain
MVNQNEIIRAWNQRVGEGSAHIVTQNKEALFNWYENAVNGIKLKNKKIVDYGIGGGLFFEWLINKYPIQSYTGYEIAQRQIDAFKKTAQNCQFMNYKIIAIKPYEIPNLNIDNDIDILFAIALIQHAPDLEYYNYLLGKFNISKIKQIVLSYKYADKTIFRDEPYKTTHDIGNACFTNIKDIAKRLTNYKINNKFDIENNFVCFNLKTGKKIEEEAQIII